MGQNQKKEQLLVYVAPEIRKKLQEAASLEGRTLSEVVSRALKGYLNDNNEENK